MPRYNPNMGAQRGISFSRGMALAATALFIAGSIGLEASQGKLRKNQGKLRQAPLSSSSAQVKKLGTATFNPQALTVVTQSRIAFRPKLLTSTGAVGGQPVDPATRVTLPGGKTARADELVEGTNGLERTLNDLGYSLYTNENDKTTPIVRLQSHYADLSIQANDLRAMGGMKGAQPVSLSRDVSAELATFDTKTPVLKTTVPGATKIQTPAMATTTASVNPAVSSGQTKGGKKKQGGAQTATVQKSGRTAVNLGTTANPASASSSKSPTPPDFVTIDKSVDLFDKTYGDPDWFSIDFDAGLTKKATMKVRKVTANADIKATLMGKSITLFHAKAEAGGKKDYGAETMPGLGGSSGGLGPRGGRRGAGGGGSTSSSSSSESIRVLEATCLGDDLISPVDRTDAGKSRQVINGKSVNWEYSVRIPIIPSVSAVGTIGARGSLGCTLVSDANPEDGEIKIKPSIDTSVYAEVGISVGFFVASVEGGLGCTLKLLDYDLDISAGVAITRTNIGDTTYIAAATPISVSHNFETLSGRLYGFVRVSYWLPFKTREKTLWDGNLINWNGFTDSRVLYSENSDAAILGQSNIPMKTMKVPGSGG